MKPIRSKHAALQAQSVARASVTNRSGRSSPVPGLADLNPNVALPSIFHAGCNARTDKCHMNNGKPLLQKLRKLLLRFRAPSSTLSGGLKAQCRFSWDATALSPGRWEARPVLKTLF